MSRTAIVAAGSLAVGAAAAAFVGRHLLTRDPPLPPGWAEIVVLGRDDVPIPGVTLRSGDAPPVAETDARGVARFDLAPLGADPAVELAGALTGGEWDASTESFRQRVRAERTIVRLRDAIPFDVTFFDARDGRPLPGGRAGWPGEPRRSSPDPSDATIRALWNNKCGGWLELDGPAGFALSDAWPRVEPVAAGFIRRQRMTVPAWPAGRVRCRVVDAEGRPAAGQLQSVISLAYDEHWVPAVADEDGRFDLATLPLVPNAIAQVRVRRGESRAEASFHVVAGRSEFDVVLSLTTEREPGRCGGAGWGSVVYRDLPRDGDATLRVRVVRNDGTPARRVTLRLRARASPADSRNDVKWETYVVTDDEGRATRNDLYMRRDGNQEDQCVSIVLAEPGLAYTSMDVPLRPGGTADCELREPKGEEIALTVLDAEGKPVPWARVSAETRDERDWQWCPVEDGVADAAPRTDRDGRIVLRGLPEGKLWISAESCGRSARQELTTGRPATLQFTDR